MKKWGVILAAALAALPWAAEANQIRSVIAVDFLTVEVVMAEPLTEAELDPIRWDPLKPEFVFSDGVDMMGAPVPQDVRGYPNTYRIPVNGLDTDIIYKVSYQGQKAFTFKAYDEQEMEDRYKERYGDYF